MRVLVTGGDGFIGRHLFGLLGPDVLNADRVHSLDVRDELTHRWIRQFDPHVVFHLAAHHYVPWCREHPTETYDNNVGGTRALLGCLSDSLQAFVLASSAAVYGFSENPRAESDPLEPADAYGDSKVEAENLVRAYSAAHPNVRCTAARLFNVAGAGDRTPHAIPEIARAVVAGKGVKLGNLWPTRDYVHADDVAEALVLFSRQAPAGFRTYNVGTGVASDVLDVIDAFERVAGHKVPIDIDDVRKRDNDGHLVADTTKLRQELGWSPQRSLGTAVADVLQEQMAWV